MDTLRFRTKLPSEQTIGLYAPANVKTDGKTNEWGNKFQAYNTATMLYYTMANDDENLYLVMQTDQQSAIGKIFYGGITLAVKNHDKSKKTTELKVTYPLVTLAERSEIIVPLRDKQGKPDSIMQLVNSWLTKTAKQIVIAGFPDISQPDISVYNDLGLKAFVLADTNKAVNFEMQLPLKYIRQFIDESGRFDYSIIVNGATVPPGFKVIGGGSVSGGGTPPDPAAVNPIFSPTDLKATYTLAKKQ